MTKNNYKELLNRYLTYMEKRVNALEKREMWYIVVIFISFGVNALKFAGQI